MATPTVHQSDDARAALAAAGAFLRADPVAHNLVLTLLEERAAHPEPGRYWWVVDGDAVAGVCFHSPLSFNAAVTTMPAAALASLVARVADDSPGLPGVFGEASVAAAFAGAWTELMRVPASPSEGQRLYRLETLVLPSPVPGGARQATDRDLAVLARWMRAFQVETGVPAVDPDVVARRIDLGLVTVWDHDGLRATAFHSPATAGVSRVGFVFTPPGERARGWGAAVVAATSLHALAHGADRCVLYTQLENPTSNALYRRLGYEPVAEQLRYRFGDLS